MPFRVRACLVPGFLGAIAAPPGVSLAADNLGKLRVHPGLLAPQPPAGQRPVGAPAAPPLKLDVRLPAPAAAPGPAARPAVPARTAAAPAPAVTEIRADRITGRDQVETTAEGSVELRRADSLLTADHLVYQHIEEEAEATGNVRLSRAGDTITGPRLQMNVVESLGVFHQPRYAITRQAKPRPGASVPPASFPAEPPRPPVTGTGEAQRIDFEGEGQYRLTDATYSTCAPDRRDWYLKAGEVELDYNSEVGEASASKVYFKDTPIFYWPWLTFALNNQRKSGFLAPTFGSSSTNGLELTVPWYWNIAPNRDMTLAPRLLSRRGIQLNSEFRYLEHAFNGLGRVEYLPSDQLANRNRSAFTLVHNQNHLFLPGLTGNLNVNGVSDDRYFADLSSKVQMVSQANLLRQGSLSYGGSWWRANLMAQRYQTLQDPAAPVGIPYYRLPQLTLTALRPDLPAGLAFNFAGEFVRFDHPTAVRGQRSVAYPQLALPMLTSAFFLTPKVGMHMTRYNLERQAVGVDERQSRQVPIMSVDSGVVLERDSRWFGHDLLQTLEPRLYYVNIPVRDQRDIPVFDSGAIDLNFAQIFSENRYGGNDRIGDANQLTAAVVSRLIDPANGSELMRGAIGQRIYFRDQQVTLPGEVPRSSRKTDVLAAFAGRVLPRVYVDSGWQYSPNFGRTERFNMGVRYQPEPSRLLNASYRYTRDQVGQVDISGQWPLGGGWYGVGRYNYSLKESRLVEGVGGFEYDGGCWVGRAVVHRLATQTTTASTTFFVQLELNGLARIGSNPLDLLKRNIAGYGLINQPTADPVFGAY